MKPFPLVPLLLAVLAVGLAAPEAAHAQLKAGNLYGTVVDNQGSPLPGVTVTLSGEGPSQVQVTNAQGQFRFLNLPAGTKGMKTELEGFSTVDYPNVAIREGRNTDIEVTMSPAVEEVITVTTESPLLDERRISTGRTVSETELEKIPTARDPWEIARLTPPLNVPDDVVPPGVDPLEAFAKVLAGQDIGDLGVQAGYGSPPGGLPAGDKPAWVATPRDPWAIPQQTPGVLMDRINVGGNGAGQQSTWSVDGVVITDMAAQGSSPGYFDFDSFEEMQLSTGGSDADIATGGVVLNMVTKRGTNEWRGSGRYFISDDDWQAAEGRVRETIDDVLEFGGELGGPIVKDRLWIWGSYGRQEVDLLGVGDPLSEVPPPGAAVQSPFQAYLRQLYGAGYTRGCDVPGFNVFTTPGTDCGPIGIQIQNLYGTGALQGLIPDPFATPTTRIPPPATVPPSVNPLYVVNGQRVESTTGIGPEEIENVEVLTGSAATALYGSLGANGVVLITTKPGADPGGRSMIAVDPGDPSGNTVYATGTAGGTWKTTDFLTTNPDGPTWTKLTGAGDPTAFQIEDTHVFSSNFYLTGLYSVVNGGFQLVPQSGSGPVTDFRSTPGSFDSDFSMGFSSGSGQPSQGNPSGALVSSPRDFRLGSRMFDSTRSPRDGLFVTVFDRSDFTQCPNGVLGGFRPGAPVDLGNGSTFTPFTSLPVDCDSFEWDTIVPRLGLTYALGGERKTLLRASYSRFADQLGAGSSGPSPGAWFFDSYRADELPHQEDVAVEQPAAEENVFLQDRVRMGDYFSLNLGVRYDEDEASPPPVLDPGIFNPTYLSGFPTLPLDQSFGGRFRFSFTPGLDQQGPGGSLPAGGTEPGGADGAGAAPTVLLVSLGQSTGQAFRALVVGDAPATIEGVAVLEPVAASAADVAELERSMSQAGAQTVEVEAYCFEFDGQVPAAGTAYRFAPPEVQKAFEPLARVLRATERVREAGGLVPDTALDTYAPAISQWAVWAKEKGFDLESFGEAWLEHVKKNVAQAGEEFTADLEQAVRERVPGRWRDIEKILAEADS